MCLVLSSQKVDQTHEKNSEFYLPEEQVCVEYSFYDENLEGWKLDGLHVCFHLVTNQAERLEILK